MKFIISELRGSIPIKFQFTWFSFVLNFEEVTSHKWTQIFMKQRYLLLFCCIHGRGFARTPRIVSFTDKLIIAQLNTKLCILCISQWFPCYKKVQTFKTYFLKAGISHVLPSAARSIRWYVIRMYFPDNNFHKHFLNTYYMQYGLWISFLRFYRYDKMWYKICISFIFSFHQPFVSSCVQGPSKLIVLIFAVVTVVNIKS
jgi:hypothetical protein